MIPYITDENYIDMPAKDMDCKYWVRCHNDEADSNKNHNCTICDDGLFCEDFNNPDDICISRQLLWYKNLCEKQQSQIMYLQKEVEELDQEVQELLNDKLKLEDLVKELPNERQYYY